MKIRNLLNYWTHAILFIFLLFLAACEPVNTETTLATSLVTSSPTQEPTNSPIPPTVTPATPIVMIVSNREGDDLSDPEAWEGREIYSYVYQIIEKLVSRYSMDLIVVDNLSAENLTSNIKVVVSVSPKDDLAAITDTHPGIQFVAVDHPGFTPSENLSLIGEQEALNQQQAFMAGYLSALLTEDYKMAALTPSEVEDSTTITDAFVNGARFFCGACRPMYPPYNSFPQWETLPIEYSETVIEGTVNVLMAKEVEVLFVDGRLASMDLFSYFGNWDVTLVSDVSPDYYDWGQLVRNDWAGTIRPDFESALEEIFPALLEGKGNYDVPLRMVVTAQDAGLISEGRQRVFDEFADDLLNGLISPDIVP